MTKASAILVRNLVAVALALYPYISASYAQEPEQCLDLVKECFAYSDESRDSCFQTVAKHPFCLDSETGRLAAHRAEYSALLPGDSDSAPSLLGPQLVDRLCVANFDNGWLSSLVKGAPTREEYAKLRQTLESCLRTTASDVFRP